MTGTQTEASVYQKLRGHLAALRLPAAAGALPAQLEHTRDASLSHTAFPGQLLAVEAGAAAARRQVSLTQSACLPAPWQISDFDFDAQPTVDRSLVTELASLRFLDATSILLIGPPGVGKTMLAVALGHAAINAGQRTHYTTAADLTARCHRAAIEGRWASVMRFYAQPRLGDN